MCTLDNQIKRSGLRISHSKVFSSDLINSEHTGLVILTGGGIVQTRTAMVHRLCVWEVVEPRIIGSTSSFVHSRVKLKRSSLIWSSRFNYFFYLLNLASVRMSVLHVVNQKVKNIYLYIKYYIKYLLKSNFQKSALSCKSVIPPNTHIAESCKTAECLNIVLCFCNFLGFINLKIYNFLKLLIF